MQMHQGIRGKPEPDETMHEDFTDLAGACIRKFCQRSAGLPAGRGLQQAQVCLACDSLYGTNAPEAGGKKNPSRHR